MATQDALSLAVVGHDETTTAGVSAPVVPWWSFTKTAIAAAALLLVRDGALPLDGPLDGRPYTLRQLLGHTAGLGDYGDLPEYHAAVARGDDPWPVPDLLRRSRADELHFVPGTGWRYSNIGYLVVRGLVEATVGMPLGEALRRSILAPVGLEGARLAVERTDLVEVAMGPDAAGYHPGWVYHGLLVGPPREAALLLDRLLAGSLLPPALLREMLAARPVGPAMPGRPWRAPGYGLGLMTEAGLGGPAGHTGTGPGSVIAVYRRQTGAGPITAAAFAQGSDQGSVERAVFGEA